VNTQFQEKCKILKARLENVKIMLQGETGIGGLVSHFNSNNVVKLYLNKKPPKQDTSSEVSLDSLVSGQHQPLTNSLYTFKNLYETLKKMVEAFKTLYINNVEGHNIKQSALFYCIDDVNSNIKSDELKEIFSQLKDKWEKIFHEYNDEKTTMDREHEDRLKTLTNEHKTSVRNFDEQTGITNREHTAKMSAASMDYENLVRKVELESIRFQNTKFNSEKEKREEEGKIDNIAVQCSAVKTLWQKENALSDEFNTSKTKEKNILLEGHKNAIEKLQTEYSKASTILNEDFTTRLKDDKISYLHSKITAYTDNLKTHYKYTISGDGDGKQVNFDFNSGKKGDKLIALENLTEMSPTINELIQELIIDYNAVSKILDNIWSNTRSIETFYKDNHTTNGTYYRTTEKLIDPLGAASLKLDEAMKKVNDVLLMYKNAFVTLSFQIASTLFGYGVSILQIFMQNFPEKLNSFTPPDGDTELNYGLQQLDKLKAPFQPFVDAKDIGKILFPYPKDTSGKIDKDTS
jgi:hypothetical protein